MSPKKFQKYFKGSSDRIIELQNNDGSIPWCKNGVFDAWNHLESLMALNTLGFRKEVELGFTVAFAYTTYLTVVFFELKCGFYIERHCNTSKGK